METIQGTIERVYAMRDGWASILVDAEGESIRAAGNVALPCIGDAITMSGEYDTHPKFGRQFKIQSAQTRRKNDRTSIYNYLTSGFVKGIGPKTAAQMLQVFGDRTLELLEQRSPLLFRIPGITENKLKDIWESLQEHRYLQDLVMLFDGDITMTTALAIYRQYGQKCLEEMKKNPYCVISTIPGFGFLRADKLAQKMKIPKDDTRRIDASIFYTLMNIQNEGHCYLTAESLYKNVKALIGEVDDMTLAKSISRSIDKHMIVFENVSGIESLYAKPIHEAECACANLVAEFAKSVPAKTIDYEDVSDVIESTEKVEEIELNGKQRQAIRAALTNRISVITGGPGTGKTTIINAIVRAYREDETVLLAPTGKAAQRMANTSRRQAHTIQMAFIKKLIQPGCKLVIVDEASMLDIINASLLLQAVHKAGADIVFIGDINQLPPIGAGLFFRDLVRSPCVPTVELELSHRQKGRIALNAQRINLGEGVHALAQDDSFRIIEIADREDQQKAIVEEYCRLVDRYGPKEVLCVTSLRQFKKDAYTSSEALNRAIQDRINKRNSRQQVSGFRLKDRVMQTQNDYDRMVFNGDCGTVTRVNRERNELCVEFDKGLELTYNQANISVLTLAYAMSTHKAQGSEYQAVIVVQSWANYYILERALLYTAVTRAKEKVVIIGEKRAVNKSIRTISAQVRNTHLRKRIMDRFIKSDAV